MPPNTILRSVAAVALCSVAVLAIAEDESEDALDEIIVTADFLGRTVSERPGSATIMDAEFIAATSVQHFEELVNVVPNLNWSGDGHRARYFQIRGVGELEQYQGAPNPSVGFLIDDIDFSGIGTVATLFDVGSVDVLRGSQGSRYGANALGGLIYLRSTEPSAERNGRLQLMAGDDDAISIGVALGGALDTDERYTFRVSAHSHSSNGFRTNPYLGRDDTNGRDEMALRARVHVAASDDLEINLAAIFSDVDNGYDGFALDNSYTMLSDKPGKDAQQSSGVSLRLDWSGLSNATLTSVTAIADSDIDFSFDADWGNADSWAPVTYDYISVSERQRRTISQELRIASNESGSGDRSSWLLGIYVQELDEELRSINRGEYYDPFYDFADSLDDVFDSDYSATSSALFGQIEHDIAAATTLSLGLRAEHRSTDYADSALLDASPSETMWGGEASIRHEVSDDISTWLSLSRGYKAGGFNLGLVPDGQRSFGDESLTTLEAGIRTPLVNDSLSLNASVFASRRSDQQVRTSLQLVPGDPASFVFFTDNAATGKTLGLEADLRWMLSPEWELYANVGLLDASFDDYQSPAGDLGGRAQAHAPRYTFAAGVQYRRDNGFFARLDMTARDDFYFDVSHNQKSEAYRLLNARIGVETEGWLLQLWARNLFDKDYAVRGFYFGNEPPDFPNTLYTRAGDPRQLGVTIEKRFD